MKREIYDLTDKEILEFVDFETDTFHRMMVWAEEHNIIKNDLLRLFIVAFIDMERTFTFN